MSIGALAIIIACALAMRIKGGGHGPFRTWVRKRIGITLDSHNKPVGELTIKQHIIDAFLDGRTLSTLIFGIVCGTASGIVWKGFAGALGWYIGIAPDVGEIIGALGGAKGRWRVDNIKGNKIIDALVNAYVWLDEKITGSKIIGIKYSALYGWCGGALRGLIYMGIPLGLVMGMPLYWAAAAFPLCYFAGVSIEQIRTGKVAASWYIGELFWGAALGAGVVLAT